MTGRPEETRAGLTVALDGPASSGKSSVGAAAAAALGYRFCDTGLLYRGLTWLALERGVDPTDGPALAEVAAHVELADDGTGRLARVLAAGRDVSQLVRGKAVERAVSDVARQGEVRAALLDRQRTAARGGRIIMAGRDIGTVVLPSADLKIYLEASTGERARRRTVERGIDPADPAAKAIQADLERRDAIDKGRPVAPLRPAGDARLIDTDGRSLEQVTDAVVALVQEAQRAQRQSKQAVTRRSRPQDRLPWFGRATCFVGRLLIRAMTRIRIEGLEDLGRTVAQLGESQLIVAANHLSNADPPIVVCWLNPALGRQMRLMTKQEALDIPIVGWFLRANGAFGVARGGSDREAYRRAKAILDDGGIVTVFPEGTRSPTGALIRAKDGATLLALRSEAFILPVAVFGTEFAWPRGKRLPRLRAPVTLRVGTAFHLERGRSADGDREPIEAVTARLMARIAELMPARYHGVYASGVRPDDPRSGGRRIGAIIEP